MPSKISVAYPKNADLFTSAAILNQSLKEHKHEIIIDRCPKCNGVWLDGGEIEAIKEAAQTEGVAVGMIL